MLNQQPQADNDLSNCLGRKTMHDDVSIIIPSFNRAHLVTQTLRSLAAQTYSHWECVVLDDGSNDDSMELVANFAKCESRIKQFKRDNPPKGACSCRNQAVDRCSGDYLIFLDTDDLLAPFCIEQRLRCMQENPELDFAIFPSLFFENKPGDLNLLWNIDKDTDELTRQFHQDAICQGTGVIWRKSSFNRIGQWDVSLSIWQDIDLFLRAYIQGYKYQKFFALEPDFYYRRHDASISRNNFYARSKFESRIKVVQNAVQLLKQHKQTDRLRDARFMCFEIASGASASHHYDLAHLITSWAYAEGVLNWQERRMLGLWNLLCRSRLVRIGAVAERITNWFSKGELPRTIGTETFDRVSHGITDDENIAAV
jgi:GT2 family glycosyltransferase